MSDLIRTARRRLGLSIYGLAERLDVTAGAVSQLERSERAGTIKLATLERALLALGERLTTSSSPSTMSDRHLLTARAAAEAIGAELRSSDPSAALRLTSQALDHFRQARSENEIADFLEEPDETGDERWDTLLATAVAWEAAGRGLAAPPWTSRPPLAEEWVPGPEIDHSREYLDFLKATAEPAFLEKGIVMRARDLATA
ncbi:helix-turn-helix domain-containing protein [Herbiconiux sp. CPCC 205716]|uniref:Helix-turn-helix domain-containing protein n=1 Tax=Herbiconiux gentiana TaxID=2970912 RepID=A0ABT2GBC6_9MICO|nr:helix-turn-helix transcriptional regulator [Herbiconiux gentiana]MCS5713504.1 helix-turn-helix domain-containing protein [Herbiconiux gentiana]